MICTATVADWNNICMIVNVNNILSVVGTTLFLFLILDTIGYWVDCILWSA
jgi:hypothetical protein